MEQNKIDCHIGRRITTRRKSLNLTMVDLALMMDTDPKQIKKYELGISSISSQKLLQLANLLRVKPSYFFAGYGDEQNSKTIYDEAHHLDELKDETLELINIYYRVRRRETRGWFIEFLKNIVAEQEKQAKK
jgi:transcriptional regulator with XRE-family HTH domain